MERLTASVTEFGHRNWIVVADAAYPAHSAPGIETTVSTKDHLDVLRAVLAAIANSGHLSATAFVDEELERVPDGDAPGATAFREQLQALLPSRTALPHEEIIHKLHEAAQQFRVLLIKTPLRIPYTSVFLELGCGYWNKDAERRLRS